MYYIILFQKADIDFNVLTIILLYVLRFNMYFLFQKADIDFNVFPIPNYIVLRLNIVMIIILSAEQVKQKAILDGLLNVFRGAPDVVEDAMDLGESEQPCHARPKYENLVRLVNKRRRTNRPAEPSKADIDFEVLMICYLVHIMLYVL